MLGFPGDVSSCLKGVTRRTKGKIWSSLWFLGMLGFPRTMFVAFRFRYLINFSCPLKWRKWSLSGVSWLQFSFRRRAYRCYTWTRLCNGMVFLVANKACLRSWYSRQYTSTPELGALCFWSLIFIMGTIYVLVGEPAGCCFRSYLEMLTKFCMCFILKHILFDTNRVFYMGDYSELEFCFYGRLLL